MKGQSLRFRMMLLFCLVVGVFLLSTYAIIYSIFARELRLQLDRRLSEAGVPMVADLAANAPEEDVFRLDLPDEYLELVDGSGATLNMSPNWREHPIDIGPPGFSTDEPTFRTVQGPGGQMRVELIPFRLVNRRVALAIAGPTRDIDIALDHFRKVLLILLPLSLLLMAAISAWYVGRSLSPIAELTAQAARLTRVVSTPGQVDVDTPRLVSGSHDELGHLAATFNELFARVVAAFQQLRQFVSNASHELRTPLSVLQGETELLLAERREPEDYQKTLKVIHGELRHLSRIVEGLFTLSMADAGQLRVANDALHMNEVLEEACEIAVPLARSKGISIDQNLQPEIASTGDESFLRDLFLIFLENAVKYSPPNTRIQVNLSRVNGSARVQFQDQGIGIPPEHLPHIFERFYRATGPDPVEARSGGLGLAIAQAIANAHGGRIECETVPGRGSTFTVTLPVLGQNGSPVA
ncbi:MAG TPA: HAMP domain-containing sensor histidine kinase [Candidatus Acidoferrales bacterium]|nr:HAMP domain-containing sensor histidine kinase [Candidatus Acidoferrales bacterium]